MYLRQWLIKFRKFSAHLRNHICPVVIFKKLTKFIFINKNVRKCHVVYLACMSFLYVYHYYINIQEQKTVINLQLYLRKKKLLFENLSHGTVSAFGLYLKDGLEGTINESRLKGNRVCNSACCYVATSNYTHVHFPREETTASDD